MRTLLAGCFILLICTFGAHAADEKAATSGDYAYYGFEPEIVTNYISTGKKLGFVKIGVEVMVKNPDDLLTIERHDPLLRAAIVEILGNQSAEKVKSLTGREDIRRECFDMMNNLLVKEEGSPLITNVLFTSYIYD